MRNCRLGIWPVAIIFFLIAFAITTRADAAGCGSPPDPRTNTGGYISWCVCMGGVYNTGTTACVGARGPRTGGGTATGPSFGWPAQHWYCRARASNGANGWARYADRGRAESEAVSNCSQHSRGRACRVVGCNHIGDTATSGASPGGVANVGADWYCRARAGNGASGWGRSTSRSSAERNALGYCDQNARGSACRIVSCTADGKNVPVGSPSVSAPPAQTEQQSEPAASPFRPFRESTATCGGRTCLAGQSCGPANRCYNPDTHFYCGKTQCIRGRDYKANSACGRCASDAAAPKPSYPAGMLPFGKITCQRCYNKLRSDIARVSFSAEPQSYIAQAVAGYDNCRQQAGERCTGGERFRAAANGCTNPGFNHAGVRSCVRNVLKNDPRIDPN